MSAYDPQPRRGRTAVAVLLAVALLAVVGAVGGYLLGQRELDRKAHAAASNGPANPAGKECPKYMEDAAKSRGATLPLTLRLHVTTKKQGATGPDDPFRSDVWICASSGKSGLWYQGHAIQKSLDEPVSDDTVHGNGILLDVVNSIDNDRYVATYDDGHGNVTTYTVSSKELEVQQPTGTRTEVVVRVET